MRVYIKPYSANYHSLKSDILQQPNHEDVQPYIGDESGKKVL